jgi:predicted transcriptional regulator
MVAGPRLGALEGEVMAFAWSRDEDFGVNDILVALRGRRRAYTTVMTIVTRLCEKGLLERRRAGRAFVYRAAMSKEDMAARALREVLAGTENPNAVLARFVDDLEGSPELISRLRAIVDDPS